MKLASADVAVATLSRGQALAGIFEVAYERESAPRELSLVVVPNPEGAGPPSAPPPIGPPTMSITSLDHEGARVTIHGGDAAGEGGPKVTIGGEEGGERAEITIHGAPPAPVEP